MAHEHFRISKMPYLQAIQAIPGNTAGEKYRWIGKLALNQASGDPEQLPPELLPILQVETAVKKKRHEDITLALKSEDATIINRALKASWFFDGSHKKTVDVAYFCERLFPYVSLQTRTRIVGTLAYQLTGKDPAFAQEMFTAVASDYGIQNAYSLLVACDEAFIYKTITEKKLALPFGIVKKIFRKNPDLVVRFLKLLKPHKSNERADFTVDINRYNLILPKLIKKRIEAFAELYEMHKIAPPNIVLSNTCSEIFLKKGLQYLLRNPSLYIRILPLKKINAELMETIFRNLLPIKISSFKTNDMLHYLKHYPQDKGYELLRKTYRSKYGVELLDETDNVTPELLRILPSNERIKQARIKIAKEKLEDDCYKSLANCEMAWICYLSINEAIPAIKEQINKSPLEEDRLCYIRQMIYACKVNEDEDALFETLTYFKNRHKNESFWLFERTMDQVSIVYDAFQLSERNCSLLWDIIQLFYVKYGYATETILHLLIHFKLLHNKPIEDEIFMLLETNDNRWNINFNIMKAHPQYEKQCLITFAKAIEERYNKKEKEDEDYTEKKRCAVCRFVKAMYSFNDRIEKSHTKIERLTIKDYPWIMDITRKAIYPSKEDIWEIRDTLLKKEPELHNIWCSSNIADVTSGAALALLKQDSQSILNHWSVYLSESKNRVSRYKSVQRFIRATRWYKDIPIKFATSCIDYLSHVKDRTNASEISSNLAILALLLQGDSIAELITPFLPTETTVDTSHSEARSNYNLVQSLPLNIKLSNPPISLDLVARLCEGDYLTIGLRVLMNVSKRSLLPNAMSFAEKLANMRVSTRKHGIRLMYTIAPICEFNDFFRKMWDTEQHHSVREVLFKMSQNLFFTKPNSKNWSLYSSIITELTLKDEVLFLGMTLFPEIPNEYIEEYLSVWLEAIENFYNMGLDINKVNKCIVNCLETLTEPVLNLLSEDFAANIIQKYLFNIDTKISEAARRFTVLYLLPEDKDKFVLRIQKFAEFFHETVTKQWNVGHPKKSRFYPVNNTVYLFMDDLIVNYVKKSCFSKSIDPQIIDNIQTMFSSALLPTQDPKSYLMLVYAKKLQECMSNKKSFGLKLARTVPELIDIFSSLLIVFMANVLNHFVERISDDTDLEGNKLSIIEDLVESGSVDSCFIAVNILPQTVKSNRALRYDRLVEKFRQMYNPAITSILYDRLNEADFEIVMFD